MEPYPHQFATALFSFLYHLASYDAGGEALVSCGMMEALLKVIVLTNIFFPTILCQSVVKFTLISFFFNYVKCNYNCILVAGDQVPG